MSPYRFMLFVSVVVTLSCGGKRPNDDSGQGGGPDGDGSGGGTTSGTGGASGGGSDSSGGGAGGGSSGSGGNTGSGGGAPMGLFESKIAPIFRANCDSACHAGIWQKPARDTYQHLLGRTDGPLYTKCADQKRINPGDANTSLLVLKISGAQTCGGRMPQRITTPPDTRSCVDAECMPNDQLEIIKKWINDGAMFE